MTGMDSSATTNFRNDDATATKSDMVALTALDDGLLSDSRLNYEQTIKSFLEKPFKVFQDKFDATDSQNGILHAVDFPDTLFVSNPIWYEKLAGHLHFRATTVFRIQFNANPFQQGRYLMCYVPQGQVAGTYPYSRISSMCQTTQLPHVQFDLACDTQAILEIPYVSPTPFYNMKDKTGPIGTFFLMCYSPLDYGTGSSECEYTVYAYFKDIEVITPTQRFTFQGDLDLEFQAGKKSNRGKKQANVDIADQELQAAGQGPVESFFSGVTQVSEALIQVPFLSAIAAPVSWVSGALASVASWFGWSNPNIEAAANRMVTDVFPYQNNCNAFDNAYTHALRADNKIEVLPGFAGSDQDEMSLNFIAGVPAFAQEVTWTAATVAGTTLVELPLTPFNYTSTSALVVGAATYNNRIYTPCAFVARLFRYWKGSMKFTFKLVKTKFHSGRLSVAFDPGTVSANPLTIANAEYVNREIIDIRETNEFTFTIPYTTNRTYLRTTTDADVVDTSAAGSYGKLYLHVVNELVQPDTVADQIKILVEVSMASDAEFAVPKSFDFPAFYGPSDIATFVNQCADIDLEFQADMGEGSSGDPCAIAEGEVIGAASVDTNALASAKYCIGERIVSFLQLLKRTSYPGITNYGVIGALGSVTSFRPRSIGAYVVSNTTAPTQHRSRWTRDYLSILAPLYAYMRGGVRLRIFPYGAYGSDQSFSMFAASSNTNEFQFNESTAPFNAALSLGKNSSLIPWMNSKSGGLNVQCPFYNQLHSQLVRVTGGDTTTDLDVREPNDLYSNMMRLGFGYHLPQATQTINQYPAVGRQVADDFALGFFLGVPKYLESVA